MWKKTVDVNVLALCLATQLSIKSMEKAGIDGQILNINTVLCQHIHNLPKFFSYNLYVPSKFALVAISEALRKELINKESRIKISVSIFKTFNDKNLIIVLQNINPGLVDTETLRDLESDEIAEIPKLQPEDIAKTILYLLATPPHVQVSILYFYSIIKITKF